MIAFFEHVIYLYGGRGWLTYAQISRLI